MIDIIIQKNAYFVDLFNLVSHLWSYQHMMI